VCSNLHKRHEPLVLRPPESPTSPIVVTFSFALFPAKTKSLKNALFSWTFSFLLGVDGAKLQVLLPDPRCLGPKEFATPSELYNDCMLLTDSSSRDGSRCFHSSRNVMSFFFPPLFSLHGTAGTIRHARRPIFLDSENSFDPHIPFPTLRAPCNLQGCSLSV